MLKNRLSYSPDFPSLSSLSSCLNSWCLNYTIWKIKPFSSSCRNYTNSLSNGLSLNPSVNSNCLFLTIKSMFISPIISSIVELGSSKLKIFQVPTAKRINLPPFSKESFRRCSFNSVGSRKSDLPKYLLLEKINSGIFGSVQF